MGMCTLGVRRREVSRIRAVEPPRAAKRAAMFAQFSYGDFCLDGLGGSLFLVSLSKRNTYSVGTRGAYGSTGANRRQIEPPDPPSVRRPTDPLSRAEGAAHASAPLVVSRSAQGFNSAIHEGEER
jgi:hypothetical protein